MRKPRFKKRILAPDARYNSLLISKLINYIMIGGKKEIAKNLVYKAMDKIEKETKLNGLDVLQDAIKKAAPLMEVKSKRVGGATYQVPMEVTDARKVILALRWIINAAREKQGKTYDEFLCEEILNVRNETGAVIAKRDNMHKMAQANKAFAHFARF
ncbi:30S ribosomal protein S7 [Candidatus Berkelbacteria bacterium CG2_30_39_44]|uniref:Small ribosomal subunit protein uS7 n=1 Tax=Candidatus Berkelbacteria bacterium CG03_land_8_20_14_0_80_40_36 TaxID=1974509 RepID=A0A2M7CHP5_9BACT|nr:MAG: 30S ribosomal protein S7 [Candidatus Berkelbacteria bacterium CG2_30_39_44]PIR27828.1 MAG: 30S ribosomal protein S7 [Candidatus Berkelbacteria bacterium CG11_big_fil_rev_8_21_14_0_20_40_23]PIV25155.1 MAG: 30S ribosomal protein S7 [Candidatus Berkelbacteria bacterium CG03_land_8_20_14_0_80_40_36]PIX30739.1 MAG: 30S ribosomal protein S7 [Candidatus Berkelbacteria bacterium CG_4_8_14_3_um_filter_39_27]